MKLFVYGSLQHPCVWQKLLAKKTSFNDSSAVLQGWKAVQVRREVYPGLVQAAHSQVQGVIKSGLSKEDLLKLDVFEGQQYQRVLLTVNDTQGQKQRVFVYQTKKAHVIHLSNKTWCYQTFRQRGLQSFLKRYVGFVKLAGRSVWDKKGD